MLVQSNTISNVSLAGTSSGRVTQTGTIVRPPAPIVRVGFEISNSTSGAWDKLPALVLPTRVNVSSPLPGFSNFRIIFVRSLTLNTAPSAGVTTSASALYTCSTCNEIDKSEFATVASL